MAALRIQDANTALIVTVAAGAMENVLGLVFWQIAPTATVAQMINAVFVVNDAVMSNARLLINLKPYLVLIH